jgi:hypothetical protein
MYTRLKRDPKNLKKWEPSAQVRMALLQALVNIGRPGGGKVQLQILDSLQLVAFNDQEKIVKVWAHMAIMMMKNKIEKLHVDAIAEMSNDSEPNTRINVVLALGMLGPEAKKHVPRLLKALHDPEDYVVGSAAWALSRMGPPALKALARLEEIEADAKYPDQVREVAATAIDILKIVEKMQDKNKEGAVVAPGQ